MLSNFQKQMISADDIRTLADLKAYRKQFSWQYAHVDESTLTPEQRVRVGAILWAKMQANAKQLASVKRVSRPIRCRHQARMWDHGHH
jgi:hypothetical protein